MHPQFLLWFPFRIRHRWPFCEGWCMCRHSRSMSHLCFQSWLLTLSLQCPLWREVRTTVTTTQTLPMLSFSISVLQPRQVRQWMRVLVLIEQTYSWFTPVSGDLILNMLIYVHSFLHNLWIILHVSVVNCDMRTSCFDFIWFHCTLLEADHSSGPGMVSPWEFYWLPNIHYMRYTNIPPIGTCKLALNLI